MAEIKHTLQNKVNLKGQLIYRLKFSTILNLSESEFAKLMLEIENDPLIQKLINPDDPRYKGIYKRRFPNTALNQSFYELNDNKSSATEGVDVEALLEKREGMAALIQKIGKDNFEKHFLFRDDAESMEQAAQACGITLQEAAEVHSLLLDLSIHSEFFHPSSLPPSGEIHYTLIAKIEMEKDGKFILSYISPHLAAGRYMIDREKIDLMKKTMNSKEKKTLADLLQKMEWINLRQDTLQKILSEIVKRQETFLRTGAGRSHLPQTQREIAGIIKVAPSTVCRSIYGKSILLPWAEERPLKDLLINKKKAAQGWIEEILESMPSDQKKKVSDNQLREILLKKYKVKASRRSVNVYRRALEK